MEIRRYFKYELKKSLLRSHGGHFVENVCESRAWGGLSGENHQLLFKRTWVKLQHPHGGFQLSVTLVPGYQTPYSGICGH